MITKFKIFENKSDFGIPEIGDYILMKVDFRRQDELTQIKMNFINNNIGIVDYIYSDGLIKIGYINPPEDIKSWFACDKKKSKLYTKVLPMGDIVSFSKDRNDIEMLLKMNNFNL